MSDVGARSAQVVIDGALDDALRACLERAGVRMGGADADLLVCSSANAARIGVAPAVLEAIEAIEAFAAAASGSADRSVVLLGGGAHVLTGAVRDLAQVLAPRVRINAIAPERADASPALDQVCAATLYLANARVVTGQVLLVGG